MGHRCLSVAAALVVCVGAAHAQARGAIAAELDRLAGNTWIERSVSLADLGIRKPEPLAGIDARREYFLPVPPSIPIANAALQFDSSYYRGDGGKTNLILAIDGYPVANRAADKESGDIQFQLGVDGASRPNGQLRLGLRWSSQVPVAFCTEPRADANVLRLLSSTRLSYRFNGSLVRTLDAALGALSPHPLVAIPPAPLAAPAYGAAAVVGLALEQVHRDAIFRPLPAVGTQVETARLAIPPALKAIPAFAALAGGARKTLQSAQEVAAYLILADPALPVELALGDAALLQPLQAAFDALGGEFRAAGVEAGDAFDAFRQSAWSMSLPTTQDTSLRLVSFAGRPVVLVSPADANHAAAMVAHVLRGLLADRQVKAVVTEEGVVGRVPLIEAGVAATFSVLAAGDWTASFPIGRVSRDGELPVTLVADISAAPSAGGTRPVASVFFNGVLVGARQLVADGHPESISSAIPRYALGGENQVRILVQRQPASDQCREVPQAFPVSVLPSSHVVLAKTVPLRDFAGMASRFAQGGELAYPADYLTRPVETLPALVRLAAAAGVVPQKVKPTPAGPSPWSPKSPFMAVDVWPAGAPESLRSGNGQVVIDGGAPNRLDWRALDRIGEFRVVGVGEWPGVIYRTVGTQPVMLDEPVRLSRGDWAHIDAHGVVGSGGSPGLYDLSESDVLSRWGSVTQWMLGLLAAVVILLLAGAWWAGRRKKDGRAP